MRTSPIILPAAFDPRSFWAKFEWVDGCLEWQLGTDEHGYGQLRIGGVHYKSHRVAWFLNCGPLPDGLFVLHQCDNPPCAAHLYLGDQDRNLKDAAARGRCCNQNVGKTHCIRGHEFTDSNTIRRPSTTKRECRTCNRNAVRARRSLAVA